MYGHPLALDIVQTPRGGKGGLEMTAARGMTMKGVDVETNMITISRGGQGHANNQQTWPRPRSQRVRDTGTTKKEIWMIMVTFLSKDLATNW